MPPASDFQALLSEDRWIRRLASQLVGDASAADDLVQETYLVALADTDRPRSARAWLAGVLRNLWRDRARASARREHRERRAARAEATPAGDELAAEVELRKRVAEAVLALDEPLRGTVVLRFFHDRSLASIAAADRVSVSTVHERLQRALARLRAALDGAHGGRREAWAATLITLARRASRGRGTIEVVAMSGAVKVAAAVLVLGAGAAWWWSAEQPEDAPGLEDRVARANEPAEDSPGVVLARAPAREPLAPVPSIPVAAPETPAPAATAETIAGRVLDDRGNDVAGALLGWRKPRVGEEPVTSGADGAFEVQLGGRSLEENERVTCLTPELVTLIPGQLFSRWTVVVARRASFAGTVVGEDGAPIAGAELAFRPRQAFFHAIGIHGLGLDDAGWSTISDEHGLFTLSDVTGGPNVELAARARGFTETKVDLSESGDARMVVELQRGAQEIELTGLVLVPSGAPVPGARVSAGKEIVTTDDAGRFALGWDGGNHLRDESGKWVQEGVERASVIALKEGYGPAREALRERDLALPFVLQLGEPLAITGFVLDPEGQPLQGVVVWLPEPTRFGHERVDSASGSFNRAHTVEQELCDGSDPAATSDEEGRFTLGCLVADNYSVMAFDPRTASRCGPWSIAAGTQDYELVFTPEATTRVAGRVVTARGLPRVGIQITPRRTVNQAPGAHAPDVGPTYSVETDSDGRFEFERLATAGTSLELLTPPFFFRSIALSGFTDLAHLELIAPEHCDLVVELVDPRSADSLKVLDGDGRELELHEVSGHDKGMSFTMDTEVVLFDGRSRLLYVVETARTLVLYSQGSEVQRLPLALEPGERTVLRP